MNCSCELIDGRKTLSFITSWNNCHTFSPSQVSNTPRGGFEPAQNLRSGFTDWSWPEEITTAPRCFNSWHHEYHEFWNWQSLAISNSFVKLQRMGVIIPLISYVMVMKVLFFFLSRFVRDLPFLYFETVWWEIFRQ